MNAEAAPAGRSARADQAHWKRWGPYLSERAWGTVREDYSPHGTAWDYFPHDHARSRAYRWNEDGLAGICDRHQIICFALALWNGRDPILKERLFGLTGNEGNHGEDVKEYYFYLDSTPTHSYMKYLYKYPQAAFPYARAGRGEPAARHGTQPEFELLDTGVFDDDRYFDVFVEYAKADRRRHPDAGSRSPTAGPEPAQLDLLPTVWFRNTWSWGGDRASRACACRRRADARRASSSRAATTAPRWLYCEGRPELLFTENETNIAAALRRRRTRAPLRQGRHQRLRRRTARTDAVNPAREGTKAAAHYQLDDRAGRDRRRSGCGSSTSADATRARSAPTSTRCSRDADPRGRRVLRRRSSRATLSDDGRNVMRQAFAGMLWSQAVLPLRRPATGSRAIRRSRRRRRSGCTGRNHDWTHLYNADVISMPDKWEYPWYAAWDLAFHCVPLALVDPEFAKEQLVLMLREWYMHPNGQLPAYEWALRRRQPAGARLGRVARLQDREEAARRRRPRVPRARLPQAAAQLHLVGEPQGRRGQERLPGRLPRARQHRRLRSQRAAADRRAPRAVRRHELDGDVLPEHAGDRAGAGAARTRPTRTWPASSGSTSSTSPMR